MAIGGTAIIAAPVVLGGAAAGAAGASFVGVEAISAAAAGATAAGAGAGAAGAAAAGTFTAGAAAFGAGGAAAGAAGSAITDKILSDDKSPAWLETLTTLIIEKLPLSSLLKNQSSKSIENKEELKKKFTKLSVDELKVEYSIRKLNINFIQH